MNRSKPALVVIGRVELAVVVHGSRERQRLAAGTGAEVENLLARLRARQQCSKL